MKRRASTSSLAYSANGGSPGYRKPVALTDENIKMFNTQEQINGKITVAEQLAGIYPTETFIEIPLNEVEAEVTETKQISNKINLFQLQQ